MHFAFQFYLNLRLPVIVNLFFFKFTVNFVMLQLSTYIRQWWVYHSNSMKSKYSKLTFHWNDCNDQV